MMKSSSSIKIDTTIELHLLTEHDAVAMYQLIEHNRTYLREWLPWVDFTQSVEDERAFISNTRIQYQDNQNSTYAIWYQKQIVGTVGYNQLD